MQRRRAFDVHERLCFPLTRAARTWLWLAPDGGELAPGLKVFSRTLLLLAEVLLAKRDHFINPLRLERLAIGLIEGVIKARTVGLQIDFALGEPDRFRVFAGSNFVVAIADS